MNTVTLIGRLTKDPVMRKRGDNKVCAMRLAEGGRDDSPPLFINVAAFGPQGEACQRYLSKGSPVAVLGRLRLREWEDDNGVKQSEHSIAAQRVDFLPSGNGRRSGGESGEE